MFRDRLDALEVAQGFLAPIVDLHGVKDHTDGPGFLMPVSTKTSVDQHVTQVIRIANWLLEED